MLLFQRNDDYVHLKQGLKFLVENNIWSSVDERSLKKKQ